MDHDDKIIKSVPYFRTLNDETFSKLIAATTVVDLNEQAAIFHIVRQDHARSGIEKVQKMDQF